MKIDELKRIAKENDYEYSKYSITHIFTRKNIDNYIRINSMFENRIWISITDWCDGKDFNMLKAAVEFAETPPEDRGEITKTKEFIKRVEELGYKVREGIKTIDIIADDFIIATVWKNRIYAVNIFFSTEDKYGNEDKLFDLIVDYVQIPIEDREKDKENLPDWMTRCLGQPVRDCEAEVD